MYIRSLAGSFSSRLLDLRPIGGTLSQIVPGGARTTDSDSGLSVGLQLLQQHVVKLDNDQIIASELRQSTYRHEGSGAQLASYLGLDILNNVKLVIHCIVWLMIFALVMSDGVNVSFVKDFDFSHGSWVSRNSLTPFVLQTYDRFLIEQVQFCEERAKNSKINMYARQLTSARKRQLSYTGNGRYSVLKTSSSSRVPTHLISSETTIPIAAASMTSDVAPNSPTTGDAVAPISTSSSGRVIRRPNHYKDTRHWYLVFLCLLVLSDVICVSFLV